MNPMEEALMDRLMNPGFGAGLSSPAPQGPFDDPRRRRMIGGQGGQGLGGPEQGLGRLLPWLMGMRYTNMTGFPGNVNFTGLSHGIAGDNFAPAADNQQSVNQPEPVSGFAGESVAPNPSNGGGGGLINYLNQITGGGPHLKNPSTGPGGY